MKDLRSWKCSRCGRSDAGVAGLDPARRCQSCAGPNTSGDDATKQQVLAQLRDRYREARKLVSSTKTCANLEWVLAAMRNPDQTGSFWADRTVEMVALWLESLAVEIDRLFPQEVTGEIAEGALSAYRAHRTLVHDLRDATEGFVAAYAHSAGPAREELPVQPVASSNSQGKNQRLSSDIVFSKQLLTRSSGPQPFTCVMCGHERATHTVGTDGAGWCGEVGCDCGGFQEGRSPNRGQARNQTVVLPLS